MTSADYQKNQQTFYMYETFYMFENPEYMYFDDALCCRYNGYLAGYQMSFDTSKSKLTKSNFALGYSQGDFTLHANV